MSSTSFDCAIDRGKMEKENATKNKPLKPSLRLPAFLSSDRSSMLLSVDDRHKSLAPQKPAASRSPHPHHPGSQPAT
jgi:hypothetical protein